MTIAAVVRVGYFAALAFMNSCTLPPTAKTTNLAASRVIFLDQGPKWTETARSDFYSRDQGSRVMPLRWMQALKQQRRAVHGRKSRPVRLPA